MKHVSKFLTVVAMLASSAAWAGNPPTTAATTDHSQHAGHSQPAAPSKQDAFATYDANKDGFLSKAELAKHPMAAHASMADTDKDGRLNRAEFAALQKM
jgi:hypothetical protein